MLKPPLAAALLCAPACLLGQAPALAPTPAFSFESSPIALRQPALPSHPFTVTGPRGAVLGMQDGSVELWQYPVKIFSGLHLQVELDGYGVPIELNPLAAELQVSPDHSTLTYVHPAVTVRQHMFAPAGAAGKDAPGAFLFFEIESIHPATLTVSLTPALTPMWPAPQWGTPGASWQALGAGGAYMLGSDRPSLAGIVAMPNAEPGPESPYQEHPHTLALSFRVRYDPARDAGHFFPLVALLAQGGESASALEGRAVAAAEGLGQSYAETRDYYAHFFDSRTVVHTPEPAFDAAMRWAELAIDKARVALPSGGEALVAGWYPAFDSARPGFGWFFGRDALWSMYAIDAYGDTELARDEFVFLLSHQRADGKVMHERSQTADELTGEMSWDRLPYQYAAADATPLLLLAMRDYLRATGDLAFVREQWPRLALAYHFESTHDSDGDGVYDNAEGTGWVEGWPPKMPHQELYLAALDRDATGAFADLARATGHPDAAEPADARLKRLQVAEGSYRLPSGLYAFSENADHSYDPTQTIYPSVAFWLMPGGLPNAASTLSAWSSHHFQTDWGTRALNDTDPLYDPISYHQGTVWPLFTGWNAMAQYRAGRPLAGWAALSANMGLMWAQDPGSVTEVLSGRFYEPLGRSSTHQLWSSAMVLAPALREVFGLEPDVPNHTLLLHPHLRPSWEGATLEHVRMGDTVFAVSEQRQGDHLHVAAHSNLPSVLCLVTGEALPAASEPCREAPAQAHTLDLPLPALEAELAPSGELPPMPLPGEETERPRITDEQSMPRSLMLTVEARAGATVALRLVANDPAARRAHASTGTLDGSLLTVRMPAGDSRAWVTVPVTLTW